MYDMCASDRVLLIFIATRTRVCWTAQGIARVEREGYDILKVNGQGWADSIHARTLTQNRTSHMQELGADPLRQVLTAGGGSKNPTWTRMRERILGVRRRMDLQP